MLKTQVRVRATIDEARHPQSEEDWEKMEMNEPGKQKRS